MAKSREQVLDKFKRNVAGAGPDYEAGVKSPKRSWLEGYKSGAERMKQALQKALAEERHIKGAEAAGDSKWQAAAASIGKAHYTEAAARAAEGYGKVVDDVLEAGEAARAAAEKMPNVSITDRIRRSAEAQLAVHRTWARKKGQTPEA